MYDGTIDWEETYSEVINIKGISGWHAFSDAGARYGISCNFRTASAHYGNERGNLDCEYVGCLAEMDDYIAGFREDVLPKLGNPARNESGSTGTSAAIPSSTRSTILIGMRRGRHGSSRRTPTGRSSSRRASSCPAGTTATSSASARRSTPSRPPRTSSATTGIRSTSEGHRLGASQACRPQWDKRDIPMGHCPGASQPANPHGNKEPPVLDGFPFAGSS